MPVPHASHSSGGAQAVRPAATIMVVRDAGGAGGAAEGSVAARGKRGTASDDGASIEVLMVRRNPTSVFVGGAHVFPGGALAPEDASPEVSGRCAGRTDAAASALLGLEAGGLAFWVAAIRECFEEAGILFAYPSSGDVPGAAGAGPGPDLVSFALPEERRRAAAWQRSLNAGGISFDALCAREGLVLATERVHYFGHWVTPEGAPRRFDTRFFVAAAPPKQSPVSDAVEIVDEVWIRPDEALRRHAEGSIQIVLPTLRMLQAISVFVSTADLLSVAEAASARAPAIPPYEVSPGRGVRIPLPGEPGFDGAPARQGAARAPGLPSARGVREPGAPIEVAVPAPVADRGVGPEPVVGRPVAVAPGIVRVTAPNPGIMTGPGTNTYLVGGPELAVVDPGPDDEAHRTAIVEAARASGGTIRWVLVTHAHPDHAPGAAALARSVGAEVLAFDRGEGLDPDRTVPDGFVLEGPELRLRAVHTPGHASDHLCWLAEPQGMLLSGDHVMHGATVVIRPPDGDMTLYLSSLDRLLRDDLAFATIGPGHGRVIADPAGAVRDIAAHRLARERAVATALAELGHGTVDELLPLVYADVAEDRLPIARHSLWAHLRKLAAEGRAELVWDGRASTADRSRDDIGSAWLATAATAP